MYTNVDDPPKLTSLSKNDRLALVYNEVVNHIARLKASGRIPEGMDLSAEGITSQIILESGWGGSRLAKESNNFGGLTAGKAWKGPVDTVKNDPITGKTYNYRVFDNPLKGIQAQVEFYLPDVNSRYAKAGVLTAKNADEHFARVKAAGYAEDANYVSKLSSFVRSTIRPRLKRGGDQEALNEWYASQDNYNNNEEFVKALETEDNNLSLTTNEVLDNQTYNNYESKAKKDAVEVSNENTLDEGTMQVLNLTDSNPESAITTNLDLGNIESTQPQIFSEETEKQNAAIAQQQLKKEMQLQQIMNASIMEDNNPSFGQGMLFGADRRTGGYINRFNNGGTMYPKYFNPGGPLDGVDPVNPIKFNVDGETGNLKMYDPQTNSFKVTNVPYEGDTTGMMSHMGERFLGTDNKSREAVYGQLKMAQDFSELEKQRANVAKQQLAERTDMLIDKKGEDFLPSTTYNFLAGNGGKSGCMAGSSGCFEPTEEQIQDLSYKNELTVPYFVKSKDDRYVKQILPFKNTSPEGFAQTYKNTEFRPNIFPTARVKNPNFGKVNSSTGNVDNREYITKTTSKGNTRSEGSTQTPGGILPTITGSATYIAQYPKLGLDEVAVGEPIEAGDRITSGGRKGQYYDENLQRYVTSDEIKRTGKSNEHHNYGIGTEKGISGYLDNEGNPIKEFNVGAIGGNILYKPNFKKQEYGPDSAANYSGSGNLVTRYEGDNSYYNFMKQNIYKNFGFDEASGSDYIKNYEQSQVPLTKLPAMEPGLLEQKSSGNIIRGEGYPNTRKGREQKESNDAYINWYMSQMQKK